MPKEEYDDEIWEILGFIKISRIRYITLKALDDDFLMPIEISNKTDLRVTQVSYALNDLKSKKLVECKNENSRKGRIYQNTELGSQILKIIEKRN